MSLHLHNQPEKAQQALEKACELEPDNADFLLALALLYDNHQQYAKALDCIDRALNLRPGSQEYKQVREMVRKKLEEE